MKVLSLALTLSALAASPVAQTPCGISEKLLPTGPTVLRFGQALDVDGDRLVIGAPGKSSPGANIGRVNVARFESSGWVQEASVTGSGATVDTAFGRNVSLYGTTFAAGSSELGGSVYVFEQIGGLWTEVALLLASDAVPGEGFGDAFDLGDGRLAISAPSDNTMNGGASGSVYIFSKKPAGWVQGPKLIASDGSPLDRFGEAIALDGDRLLVSAPFDHNASQFDVGSVYVFDFDGAAWNETAKLQAPVPTPNGFFGLSLDLDGDVAAIGAPGQSAEGGPGSLFVWRRNAGSWDFEQQVDLPSSMSLGYNVRLAGDALVSSNSVQFANSVAFFRRSGGQWQEETTFTDPGFTRFGRSVGLTTDRLAIGAPVDDDAGSDVGAVYAWRVVTNPTPYCTAKVTAAGCLPAIDFAGTASASGQSVGVITAREVPNLKPGLLFYGESGATALPFVGGTLCVLPPLVRTFVQLSGGNPPPDDCSGAYVVDFSQIAPLDPSLAAGSTVHAQYWFRDPDQLDGTGAGLSDAVAFELCD